MVHLTIDEHPVEVVEGRTILEACREFGFDIPTLCYHPALEPYGACRLCVVEATMPGRAGRLVASCVTPCEEGMAVLTASEPVQRSRRLTAELLLAEGYNHPAMLALAHDLGVKEVRFRLPEETTCILCGLCVRACREIVGVGAISLVQRGISKKVSPPFKEASAICIGCGTCVLVCPTGALSLREVTGFRSVHPVEDDFEREYCQVCSEMDLSPKLWKDASDILAPRPGAKERGNA